MTRKHDRRGSPQPQSVSRRDFLKLAAAGLLAGCNQRQQPTLTPTPTQAPTATPAIPPPASPSKVVHAHHAGVWDGEELVSGAIRQVLDGSITELTGLNDAREAWASLFDPGERIAIKVNAFSNSIIWTHVPLVMAVAECLQEVGVPARQIVIFDYATNELEEAGFPVNRDGPGVRCYGTDDDYADGFQIAGATARLSNIVVGCDALINVPVLKSHMLAGISFAMKNHYGTISNPAGFHGSQLRLGIAELNGLPPIKDRTRLIVGDALEACLRHKNSYPYWSADYTGDSIFMSFDPVAHDTVGLQLFSQLLVDSGGYASRAEGQANPWLRAGAELGLGTNNLDYIDLVETNLG